MPHIERTVIPNERGAAKITLTFTKADGTADTPTLVKWSLVDNNSAVINNRERVVASPGATVTIYLSGADLLVRNSEKNRSKVKRWLVIEGTGSDGYNIKDTLGFELHNLKYISQSTATTTTTTTTTTTA